MSTLARSSDISAYLVQDVDHFPKASLYTISPAVPFPAPEYVIVDALLIHKYVLNKLSRIVVQ